MLVAELIVKARDGEPLSREEIDYLIAQYSEGAIPDYQMAAWAMAVCIRGMPTKQVGYLTTAMLHSGDRLPRDQDGVPRVDKHSTGGLGDKVSLLLAPLLACCDVRVPMISGRGLGLTGGTLDKLESIPGLAVDFDAAASSRLLRQAGCFIIGASDRVAPADRKLYALRDVTGCVESVPLITASILSKKLAGSLDALVMDVKVGRAAFMKTLEDARRLAVSLVETGRKAGLPVTALLTDMDQPLGHAVGNAIEVNEAASVLTGSGPRDVRRLTIALAAESLLQVGRAESREQAVERLEQEIDSGRAIERFRRMIAAQGGRYEAALPLAKEWTIVAESSGWLQRIDCKWLGEWIVTHGGGRRKLRDAIDHRVGINVQNKIGDHVERGDVLCNLYVDEQPDENDRRRFIKAFSLEQTETPKPPLIHERVV